MAVLVPCLVQLRAEFREAFPRRDTASDGWIADALHSPSSHHSPDEASKVLRDHDADHKDEVHALDVDEDLRDAQTTMSECVMEVWRRHRDGRDNRITEIIYERRIATAARGWVWRDYGGPNPHDKHAHFSASYTTSRENDVRPFGVAALARREDPPVPLTAADVDLIWNDQTTIPGTSDIRTMRDLVRYLHSASKIAELSAAATVAALAGAEGAPLYELAQEVQKIRDDLMVLMSDPADSADPEGHPIVMAIRYANANPPA